MLFGMPRMEPKSKKEYRNDPDHVIGRIPRVNEEIIALREIEGIVAQFEDCHNQMEKFSAAERNKVRQSLLLWLPKAIENIDGRYAPEFGRQKKRLELLYRSIGGNKEN
ncbi:MAG: hypothetical protein U0944_00180 [Candidatus Moranbacteria bacterium]|nr:hypothetical protein [Candidatus Moranbacteria bacterium]MDZ4384821.1 hypothetical protein [Candidatus Moranbacteria bacterium]